MKHFNLEQSENNPTSRDKIGSIFFFVYFLHHKNGNKEIKETKRHLEIPLCVVVFASNAILYENLRLDS